MEKLTGRDQAEVQAYLAAAPEYNIFVQGDLENFGFDSDAVELFGLRDAAGALSALVLRYFSSWCLGAGRGIPHEQVAAFLRENGAAMLSGRESDVAAVAAHLPGWRVRGTNLARMDRPPDPVHSAHVRMLTAQDAPAVIELEMQIEEFADSFCGVDRAQKIEECRGNLTRGGHAFGVFDAGRLVSLAETTAENSVSAMIVGVATLPAWRGRGFARACVQAAAAHCLTAGRQYLCLFYDNPAAGRIYHALGFADVGRFGTASPAAHADG